ncbi:MAG: outer membrane protein assembly factor BamE [Alphaproteobacteria bacterium]|nr:outer membrane protein assembly factor BamE [Alphaproteobacteria bacterium]
MNYLKSILILIVVVVLYGCSSGLRIEGNYIFPDKLDKIKPGLSKDQVFAMLGATTIKANFNENTWYYIYEKYNRKLRFLNKTIIESKVIIINFDENNKIKNVEVLDYNKRRNIPIVRAKTQNILIKTNPRDSQFNNINTFSSN